MKTGAIGLAIAAALGATVVQFPAQGADDPSTDSSTTVSADRGAGEKAGDGDNLAVPVQLKQEALRKEAIDKLIHGKAKLVTRGGDQVIRTNDGQYVQYGVDREESIFTVLVDFGDQIDTRYGGTPGPVHNQIPEPDRDWNDDATDDNSTYWVSDFNRAHYQDLMFGDGESFKDFYTKLSSGRFLAKGDVSDWAKLPFNEARYGSGAHGGVAYSLYVKHTAQAWYDAQKAAGKSDAEIKSYLSQFDQVDRYDYDGDGNFNEPDGYIDHFQAIHAGMGEEAGGGAQGTDAIWSHRSFAYASLRGTAGPDNFKNGGVPIGDSGIWIGDYTTEPENGGLGVFTHEFGHDLGLPDLYDTNGGDNGTGFWTLMSGGSWLNHGTDSIGSTPDYYGPWEKLQLGWLDYKQVDYGQDTQVKLGPADLAGKMPNAILVNLPNYQYTTDYNKPYAGTYEWWSGTDDNLDTSLAREVDLTGATTSASVNAKLWYDIEPGCDCDWLYGEVSTDGGSTWTRLGTPINGSSNEAWVDSSYDLSAYKGQKVLFRYHYTTDGGLHLKGVFLDDINLTVDGVQSWKDDVETTDAAWTAKGFTRFTGSETKTATHYYLAENRVYSNYDATLKTGPYNFGWATTKVNWVERFPYQNGLLVWYSNGRCADNNTIDHPGCGEALPVDARPEPIVFADGVRLGNRRQPWDATFGQEATDAVTFHRKGTELVVPSSPAIPTFDDTDPDRYWSAANPWASTKVAGTGTTMTVVDTSKKGFQLIVNVLFN
ncbi:MAG TPA: immune inhibitor A domain-containing protein [Nocardioides sp.]